jgi:uncharacterized protein
VRRLELAPGAAHAVEARVPVEDLSLGGQRYALDPSDPVARIDVVRALSGLHLRLRAAGVLVGPCWRCLSEARVPLEVDATEFAADGRPPDAPFDDDLDSAYLEDGRLDVATWLRDAVVDALPATILCREDCAGLCPSCGTPVAEGCDCAREETDPRWSALEDLAERLRREAD